MKLQKKIEKVDKAVKKRLAALFRLYTDEVGQMIDEGKNQTLLLISSTVAGHPPETLMNSHTLQNVRSNLYQIWTHIARRIEVYWTDKRLLMDLANRVSMSYVDHKASPPWAYKRLDISKPLKRMDAKDPRKGHMIYRFNRMVDQIMSQIQRGALNGESEVQIMRRVRSMFDQKERRGVREAFDPTNRTDPYASDPDNLSMITEHVDIETGFFSERDIQRLQTDMMRANQREFRQYRPWFTDELKKNNRELAQFEQDLLTDAVNVIHSGQTEQMPQAAGLSDLRWQVQRPGVCKCCDKRDGLTMSEIKKTIKDEYGDQPPRLHPNCNCELVPVLADDWKDSDLEDQGVKWDPETGDLTVPKSVKKKYMMDLSLDEYIGAISKGNV